MHILNVHINFSSHYFADTITIELCFCVPGLAKTPFLQIFIYLAELGLSCIVRGLFAVVLGLSSHSWSASSLAIVHRLEFVGSKLWGVGLGARGMWDLSFLTRNPTCISCITKQILNHWTPKEVL